MRIYLRWMVRFVSTTSPAVQRALHVGGLGERQPSVVWWRAAVADVLRVWRCGEDGQRHGMGFGDDDAHAPIWARPALPCLPAT